MTFKIPNDFLTKASMLSLEDKILLFKYLYGQECVGEENLPSDLVYDNYVSMLDSTSPLKYLDWDEVTIDDIQESLFTTGVIILNDNTLTEEIDDEPYRYLQDLWGKNSSITMEDNLGKARDACTEIFQNIENTPYANDEHKAVMTLKYDGWNITAYYIPDNPRPVLIHTRARSGNCIYCTKILQHLFPELQVTEPVRVVSELCLASEALPILRETYSASTGKLFKNTRNSVSSIVHGTVDVNLIAEHIHFYSFFIETQQAKLANSVTDMITLLTSLGFRTPACCSVASVNHFDVCFDYMEKLYTEEVEPHIKCDGVVLSANNYDAQQSNISFIKGNNQKGLLAIKDGIWSRKVYSGKVLDIIATKVNNRCLVAIIEPTVTASGSEVQQVPLINFSTACNSGRYVDVGDTILFTYHSQQIVHFEGIKM